MNLDTLYVIDQKDGLGLEFSKLVSMMNYTRYTTIEAVKALTVEELDFLYDEEANSIGMLLAHLAAVEKAYQIETFENRDLTEKELSKLLPGLDLGNLGREQIKGNTIDYYLEQLAETRNTTIETFKTLPDNWLYEQAPFWWERPANNFFKWFHVFEDELSHRGQIRLIKKMLSNRNR
ncbi:DinB family protein [Bacillus sp. sid0103]|uniref:DinB family protein n=1 Tax=Bacillus sp. sid0103 TaxID=2856337 RepID=UPI001C442D64|nr:DinB family protein [Bacillus sp. sid0103]MBV7506120.1 DinB family protein [Bacillus sp. sid0103]